MGGVGGLVNDHDLLCILVICLCICHLVAEVAALLIITLVPAILPGLNAFEPLLRWLGRESNFAL